MTESTLNQAALKILEQRRHKRWQILVGVLASIVVFVTTYLLILPAITKETKTYCGYEDHIHTDECYSCYAEYTEAGIVPPACNHNSCTVICGHEAHEHTEMCYINCHTVAVSMTYDGALKYNADKADEAQINQTDTENEEEEKEENQSASDNQDSEESETENEQTQENEDTDDSLIKWERHITVRDGEILLKYLENFTTLPNGMEAKKAIWYNAENNEVVSLTDPVVKDLELYAKFDEIVEEEELPTQPEEETTEIETTTEKVDNDIHLNDTFTYENDEFVVNLDVKGTVKLSEEAAQNTDGKIEFIVNMVEESDESYKDIVSYAEETRNAFDVVTMQMMEYKLLRDGEELDLSDCEVKAKITPTDELLNDIETVLEKDKENNSNTEISAAISAYEQVDGEVNELGSIYPYDNDGGETVLEFDPQGNYFALYSSTTANPHFTVEYKAFIDSLADSGDVALDIIIDTSAEANGGKPKLPQNGIDPKTKKICIDYLPGSKTYGQIAMKKHFDDAGNMIDADWIDVFAKEEFEYIKAPNIDYFNKFYGDNNYDLIQVKVGHNGHWHAFVGDFSKLHFTNRTETSTDLTGYNTWISLGGQGKNHTTASTFSDVNEDIYILIDDATTIQLACKPTDGMHNNDATFYDYDITDGYIYNTYADSINKTNPQNTSTQKNNVLCYANTRESGINSAENYHDSGVKLAFGNANTGSVHADNNWKGNTLNRANRMGNSYKLCTFGLTSGLDENGNIIYSDQVSAPNLFNDGYAVGKEVYDNYSLDFKRHGDTYTLTAVNGAGTNADTLEYFNKPTCGTTTHNIWTNNFWPMDSAPSYGTDTHDLKFGDNTNRYKRYRYDNASNGAAFSPSDDGVDHNSYFGMHYAVEFELTADYVGPLEYTFFGDDDMWVFLDGKLVCDIGGVHSTVGEYVNLWDYLVKGSTDKHTLSFFYTERGASGSSCFMQFTLPSVSSATPEQNTGDLRIEKEVTGVETEFEFSFDIHFTDADGNYLLDDYSYSRYSAEGELIDWDIIVWNGGSFKLKDNEYIIIKYLPDGTKFTITEQPCEGYTTSTMVNNGEVVAGGTATGSIDITKEKQVEVRIINEAGLELPSTGGGGTVNYILGGLCLTAAALIYGYRLRYKNKKGVSKKQI